MEELKEYRITEADRASRNPIYYIAKKLKQAKSLEETYLDLRQLNNYPLPSDIKSGKTETLLYLELSW